MGPCFLRCSQTRWRCHLPSNSPSASYNSQCLMVLRHSSAANSSNSSIFSSSNNLHSCSIAQASHQQQEPNQPRRSPAPCGCPPGTAQPAGLLMQQALQTPHYSSSNSRRSSSCRATATPHHPLCWEPGLSGSTSCQCSGQQEHSPREGQQQLGRTLWQSSLQHREAAPLLQGPSPGASCPPAMAAATAAPVHAARRRRLSTAAVAGPASRLRHQTRSRQQQRQPQLPLGLGKRSVHTELTQQQRQCGGQPQKQRQRWLLQRAQQAG
jgi:hypothetical protein